MAAWPGDNCFLTPSWCLHSPSLAGTAGHWSLLASGFVTLVGVYPIELPASFCSSSWTFEPDSWLPFSNRTPTYPLPGLGTLLSIHVPGVCVSHWDGSTSRELTLLSFDCLLTLMCPECGSCYSLANPSLEKDTGKHTIWQNLQPHTNISDPVFTVERLSRHCIWSWGDAQIWLWENISQAIVKERTFLRLWLLEILWKLTRHLEKLKQRKFWVAISLCLTLIIFHKWANFRKVACCSLF